MHCLGSLGSLQSFHQTLDHRRRRKTSRSNLSVDVGACRRFVRPRGSFWLFGRPGCAIRMFSWQPYRGWRSKYTVPPGGCWAYGCAGPTNAQLLDERALGIRLVRTEWVAVRLSRSATGRARIGETKALTMCYSEKMVSESSEILATGL